MSARRGAGPERVGDLVERLLKGSRVGAQLRRHEVLDGWPRLVGDAIAQVTRARSLVQSTLFVEVRSSAWLMELDLLKVEIQRRLNAGLEDAAIERVVFVLAEEHGVDKGEC